MPSPAGRSASSTASNHPTGAGGWKTENMTRSSSATVMPKTHQKCWLGIAGSVVMDGAATLTTPSVLGTFYGSGVREVKRYPLMGVNRMRTVQNQTQTTRASGRAED